MTLKTTIQSNKKNTTLPVGISGVWRRRDAQMKRPYFEFRVCWSMKPGGEKKVKGFYVGVYPTSKKMLEQFNAAVQFRKAIETFRKRS